MTHWFLASGGDSLIPPLKVQHARLSGKGARLGSHHLGVKQITTKPIWHHGLQAQLLTELTQLISTCQSQHPPVRGQVQILVLGRSASTYESTEKQAGGEHKG